MAAGRWRGSLAEGAPALGLAAFVAGLALRPMEETDLFFRLATGEQILNTGRVPRQNLFSFTHPAEPYLDSAWLFDTGAALLHRAGGFPALVAAKALLLALVFAGAYALCRRRGAGPLAAAGTLALAALVMSERLVERPHLFSFAGLVAVLALLAAAERRPRALIALAAITALWANLHAGAFLAPLVVAVHAAGLALDRRRAGQTILHPLPVALAAGACAATLLLTPVGPGLFQYLAFHMDIHRLHPVDEFRTPSWRWDAPLLLFAAATALTLLLIRRPPARFRDLLPAALLALLTARSVRFGAELALVMAPLLAERLSLLAGRWRAPLSDAPLRPALLAGAVLALAAVAPRVAAVQTGRPVLDIDLARHALPLDALAFTEAHGLRARMYNDFELGGYLAFTGYPRHRVFTDPRLPAYPRTFHTVMGRADLGRAEWDAWMDRHGVDSALLADAGVNRRLAWWDPARWALVHRQGDARVFVRRLPRHAALIAAREIPATFSFSEVAGTRTVPLPGPPPGSSVPDCEWQLRLGDLVLELDRGDPTRALAAYRRALQAPPGCLDLPRATARRTAVGAGLMALALEALGRRAEARQTWQAAADRSADRAFAGRARQRADRLAAPPP